MILVERVSKSFGPIRALRDVSFQLAPRQVAGLLGPNGAGKSTTIRLITGYLRPDAGRLIVGGHDLATDSLRARGCIGYLPETAPLYPEMTPESYLRFRARLFGIRGKARREAVGRVVERCWLTGVRGQRISTLSKGYRQRVGLAAALIHEPPVLVLDEPTSGLDPTQIRESRRLIRELASDRTMLISSHILSEIEQTCDRVIVMAGGRVRADGTPSRVADGASPTDHYLIEVRPGAQDAGLRDRLARVSGIGSVRVLDHANGWDRLRLDAEPGRADLREAIARILSEQGVLTREIHRARPTLEDAFISLVEHDNEPEEQEAGT